jgi:hypothetical protein
MFDLRFSLLPILSAPVLSFFVQLQLAMLPLLVANNRVGQSRDAMHCGTLARKH